MDLITYIRRKYTIYDMALFDLIGTIIFALILGYLLKFRDITTMFLWIITVFLIGIVTHILLGVNTMLGYYLGLNDKPIR